MGTKCDHENIYLTNMSPYRREPDTKLARLDFHHCLLKLKKLGQRMRFYKKTFVRVKKAFFQEKKIFRDCLSHSLFRQITIDPPTLPHKIASKHNGQTPKNKHKLFFKA